jgi:hypothetical protein
MCERSFDKIKAIFKEYDERLDALEQRPSSVQYLQSDQPVHLTLLTRNADIRQNVGDIRAEDAFPEVGGDRPRVQVEELPAGPVQKSLPEPVVETPAAERAEPEPPRQSQMEFPIEDTPAALSQWRWDFSQARIGENQHIEAELARLNAQIQKLKLEVANMRRDERMFRAVAFPDKYLPGGALGPYINVFAGFADSQFSGPVAELLSRFVDDVAAENDYIRRTAQTRGEELPLTTLQIDTPLVLHQILQKYEKFLVKWEAAIQSWNSTTRPAMMGNWHEFVNDEQFADVVEHFKLPHSINEMIRRV